MSEASFIGDSIIRQDEANRTPEQEITLIRQHLKELDTLMSTFQAQVGNEEFKEESKFQEPISFRWAKEVINIVTGQLNEQ